MCQCKSNYDCYYVNKPCCNLHPISCITPCPRFSCPQLNQCYNNEQFFPQYCCPPKQNCFNPCMIWFLGGMCMGTKFSNRFSKNDLI